MYDAVTARRPIAEAAIAAVVEANENVTVRRGVAVAGLITGEAPSDGVPHVIGVRTDAGDEFLADIVIDAGGRRSKLPSLLADVGARAPIEEAGRLRLRLLRPSLPIRRRIGAPRCSGRC